MSSKVFNIDNFDFFAFLKMKQYESRIFSSTEKEIFHSIMPVFDIPKTDNESEASIKKSIQTGIKNLTKNLSENHPFFIDCKDIIDINIGNDFIYSYLLKELKKTKLNALPVISFSRSNEHNKSVINSHKGQKYQFIAIRADEDDIVDFDGFIEDFIEIKEELPETSFVLIIDFEVIRSQKELSLFENLLEYFLSELDIYSSNNGEEFNKIVITGSSLSGDFGEHTRAGENSSFPRYEASLFKNIIKKGHLVTYGDYGVVSPEYTFPDIPPQLIYKVSTPKLIYTTDFEIHTFRGRSLSQEGNSQYFDLAESIFNSPFYRGKNYSSGDQSIYDHANRVLANATSQGNWYKILNIAHFSFIKKDFL